MTRHHFHEYSNIFNRFCHWTNRVQRTGHGHDAKTRITTIAWPEPGNTTEGSWLTNGSTCVFGNGKNGLMICHTGRRTSRRTSRYFVCIKRIANRSIHGIFITRSMTKRIAVRFPHEHSPLVYYFFYDRGLKRRHIIIQNFCTGSRTNILGTNGIFH